MQKHLKKSKNRYIIKSQKQNTKGNIPMEAILNFINAMIKYIQDLVAYFRKKNDGDPDAQMPEYGA